MSARGVERALARLMAPQAILAPDRGRGGYAVFPQGDRRRRPSVRISVQELRALVSDGALTALDGECYALTSAGAARARREAAPPQESFTAQHRPIVDRAVIDRHGGLKCVRGHDSAAALRRLGAMRDAHGAPWLHASELAAAAKLRADWEAAQTGRVRGSDWSAPPRSGSARGPGNAQESALAARCDAGRRMNDALDALAPPLRRVVERVVLYEEGVEAIERQQGWPARSGKIGLKLALAQLATRIF